MYEHAELNEEEIGRHALQTITFATNKIEDLLNNVTQIAQDHYINPESVAITLETLGKQAAAKKIREKLPSKKKYRSGDLGEIFATEYITYYTNFEVPIKKLRWRDHNEVSMRGNDVIGIDISRTDNPVFLKAEAKSRAQLSTAVIVEAREGLNEDHEKPKEHSLSFMAERLRELDNDQLADIIEKAQLKHGINIEQVEHLLFTFSGSSPTNLHRTQLSDYLGNIKQNYVGLRINNHQEFITNVYERVSNAFDS